MEKFEELSPLALAFLGDAIHTAYVRKTVLEGHKQPLNTYNTLAKKFCNAKRATAKTNILPRILMKKPTKKPPVLKRLSVFCT